MINMLVKNWNQVYKSLAVWLPVLALGVFELLKLVLGLDLVPDGLVPVVAGIASAIGWVISQNGTVIAIRDGRT